MPSPHFIELDEAVSRIKQACDERTPGQPSPFFFMVGAGISFPSVPLATEIVSRCKNKALEFGRSNEPESTDPIDVYSHWFGAAYGDARQRQRYLRELIERRQITHANFRLAHLLLDDIISSIVVTSNFDDFLTKALTLFGKGYVVCDHPNLVGRIDDNQTDLQIVHLHGTHWFYDCCNLRGELQDRAQQSEQTTSTMASLLDMILWNRSPLVLGYSGWDGDVFMNALRRRLTRPLGSNAYWFCFQKSQVDSMPAWLRNDPNLRFVVPGEVSSRKFGAGMKHTEASGSSELGEHIKTQSIVAGQTDVPTLPADRVLDKLIRAFNLEAPPLTTDPLGFFAAQLEASLPGDEASDIEGDIYAIKNVIGRVKRAKVSEGVDSTTGPQVYSESSLEGMRDALRRADYRQAIILGTQVQLTSLSLEELNELSEAVWLAATKLVDDSDDEIAGYDLTVASIDRIEQIAPALDHALALRGAQALFNKETCLWTIHRSQEALAVCDEMVRRYGNASELGLRETLAQALVSKAVSLWELERNDEATRTCQEVLRRYGDAPEPRLRKVVADALNGIGYELIIRAKALFLKGDEVSASKTLEQAEQILTDALERQPDDPITLGNAAYVAFLSDRTDEARTRLTRAIQLGGEEIREGALQDAIIHELRKDEEFRELVRSISVPA